MTELELFLKEYYDERVTLNVIRKIANKIENEYWLIQKTKEEKEMTPQEYYSINIRVKPEDRKSLDRLIKKNITIVSVLRSGIAVELRRLKK